MKTIFIVTAIFLLMINVSYSQWKKCENEPKSIRILDVENFENIVFVATDNRGVLKSEDFGKSWIPVNGDTNTVRLYAEKLVMRENYQFSLGGGMLFRSSDFGANWERLTDWLISPNFNSLTVSGDTILLGNHGGGIVFSTDNGGSWDKDGTWIQTDEAINDIIINGKQWLAATEAGFRYSGDFGKTWAGRHKGIKNHYILSAIRADSLIIAATAALTKGYATSSDFGLNWKQADNLMDEKSAITHLEYDGTTLYACTLNDGLFVSEDLGATWHEKTMA